ncbi:MAG: peptidylprolyl isomerase, partial [Proteiniphilum sp.]|nr:peptidylprolyl isomerase [Proteiniphilum sp.]
MQRYLFILLWMAAVSYSQAQTKYPTIVIETNYGTMKAMLYDDTPVHNDH